MYKNTHYNEYCHDLFILIFWEFFHNGKAFVQGGFDSTIAPQSTKPNRKHQSSTQHLSPPCTNAMLCDVFCFIYLVLHLLRSLSFDSFWYQNLLLKKMLLFALLLQVRALL